MTKNILIILLALAVILETGYILTQKFLKPSSVAVPANHSLTAVSQNLPPAGPNAKGQGPVILSKGMDLTKTPLFRYAYQIAPGTLSSSAKQAITGWSIKTTAQSDGSTVVVLTPKDSEDQSQQYIVKQGETLYFIEQTPFDDKVDQDKDLNYRDDYGIIVDKNGIIQ